MNDTLRVNDKVMADISSYTNHGPEFGDIVLFKATPQMLLSSADTTTVGDVDYIKRCIGVPGDTIYVVKGVLFRKAKGAKSFIKLNEPYAKFITDGPICSYDLKVIDGHVYSREYMTAILSSGWVCEGRAVPPGKQEEISAAIPGPIPADQYLVLGDNRYNSNDSHSYGFVPRANFVAKAVSIYWPPNHARRLG